MIESRRANLVIGWALFALLAPAVFMTVSPVRAQSGQIEFLKPRNQQTILGESEIELRVLVPDGLEATRVEVIVDGSAIATLEAPPWKAKWDAGEGERSHELYAVLHLSDGTSVSASVRTSALQFLHVEEVSLVNLYAIVQDSKGNYVTDLTVDDFRLEEDDRPQKIERFTTEHKPLRVGIVMDTSDSMRGDPIDKARRAALAFLKVLEHDDAGMVVTFNDEVRVAREMTSERNELEGAIAGLEAKGGTALYDAIWRTSRELGRHEGRRVIVLLSDGKDEAANGLEPGSFHTRKEALERALRDEVMIFSIGFGRKLENSLDFYGRARLKDILQQMASYTGGRALFPSRASQLKNAFDKVAEDLRNQYSVAYASDNDGRDGAWREIELNADDDDLRVFTRRGYYAAAE
jgi:Ca-activated chloride channel family protein